MEPDDLWRALTRPGFVLSAWPWRSLAYLATTVPVGWAALIVLLVITEASVSKHINNILDKLDLPADDGHRRVLAVLTYLRG